MTSEDSTDAANMLESSPSRSRLLSSLCAQRPTIPGGSVIPCACGQCIVGVYVRRCMNMLGMLMYIGEIYRYIS